MPIKTSWAAITDFLSWRLLNTSVLKKKRKIPAVDSNSEIFCPYQFHNISPQEGTLTTQLTPRQIHWSHFDLQVYISGEVESAFIKSAWELNNMKTGGIRRIWDDAWVATALKIFRFWIWELSCSWYRWWVRFYTTPWFARSEGYTKSPLNSMWVFLTVKNVPRILCIYSVSVQLTMYWIYSCRHKSWLLLFAFGGCLSFNNCTDVTSREAIDICEIKCWGLGEKERTRCEYYLCDNDVCGMYAHIGLSVV